MLAVHQRNIDPSRSTLLRKRYESALVSRLRRVKKDLHTSIVDRDAFGLQPEKLFLLRAAEPHAFDFPDDAAKVKAFQIWLAQLLNEEVLEMVDRSGHPVPVPGEFQRQHIERAFAHGAIMAKTRLEGVGFAFPTSPFGDVFQGPVAISKLQLLYTRNFSLLKGITDAVSNKLSQELTLGLAQGHGPRQVARQMNRVVDSVGIVRLRAMARTEILRAHNEGLLSQFEAAGIEGVTLEVEAIILTAGDARVCPTCKAISKDSQGNYRVYPIAKARGLLPRHVACRCSWAPWTKDIKKIRQRRAA